MLTNDDVSFEQLSDNFSFEQLGPGLNSIRRQTGWYCSLLFFFFFFFQKIELGISCDRSLVRRLFTWKIKPYILGKLRENITEPVFCWFASHMLYVNIKQYKIWGPHYRKRCDLCKPRLALTIEMWSGSIVCLHKIWTLQQTTLTFNPCHAE